MSREKRNIIPGNFYHLSVRSNLKDPIFRVEDDYRKFLFLVDRAKDKTATYLFRYTIMPNQGHFIIQPTLPHVSIFLRMIKQSYAQYYCHKYSTSGPIWVAHSKCLIIENDLYLIACGADIENYPVKVGLVKKSEDWPYSSCSRRQ